MTQNIIKNVGFKIGFSLAFVLLSFMSYIYFVELKLITNAWAGSFIMLLNIVFGIISIVILKQKLGGFITFKESFSAYFYTIAIGSIISCCYLILLYKFGLSDETKDFIRQELINFNINLMKQDPKTTSKNIESTLKLYKTFNPFAITEVITAYLKYLLRDCIIGLLVASFFRNTRTA